MCARNCCQKNCNLIGNEYGLVAYYNFNQGTAAGNNSAITNLNDLTPYAHTGTLTGFALSGPTSNFVASGSTVTGNCAPYGPLTVSGNTLLCSGVSVSTTLTASGGITYTWSTNANSPSIVVSPTLSTTYTVVATDANTCTTNYKVNVTVSSCAGINQYSISDKFNLLVYPNPSNGNFNIKSDIDLKIKIVNELGMTIQTIYLDDRNGRIENIGNLSSGIYFLISDEGGFRKKIIVAN